VPLAARAAYVGATTESPDWIAHLSSPEDQFVGAQALAKSNVARPLARHGWGRSGCLRSVIVAAPVGGYKEGQP
jgi:hypothetical protein